MENVFVRFWHIITLVVTTAFIVGMYYMKIENMSETIDGNSLDIKKLNRAVYVLIGTLQKEYPGMNIQSYIDTSAQQNIPLETTTKGLTVLKNTTKQNGELYLIREQGFTPAQAASVFTTSESSDDNKQ